MSLSILCTLPIGTLVLSGLLPGALAAPASSRPLEVGDFVYPESYKRGTRPVNITLPKLPPGDLPGEDETPLEFCHRFCAAGVGDLAFARCMDDCGRRLEEKPERLLTDDVSASDRLDVNWACSIYRLEPSTGNKNLDDIVRNFCQISCFSNNDKVSCWSDCYNSCVREHPEYNKGTPQDFALETSASNADASEALAPSAQNEFATVPAPPRECAHHHLEPNTGTSERHMAIQNKCRRSCIRSLCLVNCYNHCVTAFTINGNQLEESATISNVEKRDANPQLVAPVIPNDDESTAPSENPPADSDGEVTTNGFWDCRRNCAYLKPKGKDYFMGCVYRCLRCPQGLHHCGSFDHPVKAVSEMDGDVKEDAAAVSVFPVHRKEMDDDAADEAVDIDTENTSVPTPVSTSTLIVKPMPASTSTSTSIVKREGRLSREQCTETHNSPEWKHCGSMFPFTGSCVTKCWLNPKAFFEKCQKEGITKPPLATPPPTATSLAMFTPLSASISAPVASSTPIIKRESTGDPSTLPSWASCKNTCNSPSLNTCYDTYFLWASCWLDCATGREGLYRECTRHSLGAVW